GSAISSAARSSKGVPWAVTKSMRSFSRILEGRSDFSLGPAGLPRAFSRSRASRGRGQRAPWFSPKMGGGSGGVMDVEKAPTLIDGAANVDGKLSGKDAQVQGRFTGEIELTGKLQLGEGAHVEAKVLADAVEIAGEFKGELVTRSLVL